MSKNDDFTKSISKCSGLIKACNQSTQNLFNYAKKGDLNNCDLESKNRDRLIKTIKKEYWDIKKKVSFQKAANSTLLNNWEKEFHLFIQDSIRKDGEILKVLQGASENLQKAITSIYQTRKKIQSYNPNNV